jgi:alkaline phosphatase D
VANLIPGRRAVSRRRFFELLGGVGAGALVAPTLDGGPAAGGGGPLPPGYTPTYPDGVMAGDPRPDGSVIWARLGAPAGGEPIDLVWEVSADPGFATVDAGGIVTAAAAANWSVHVAVDSLDPDAWYHYRFLAGGHASPAGRLRTSPRTDATPDVLRFAFASCQQRNRSFYSAHRAIAAEPDLDFFMHLGDYIYVHDTATLTLDDYRARYASFKANPWLQQVQQRVPLVAMFDDGEFYNGIDSTGDPARLAAAHQAWFETMPVIGPAADPVRAWRTLPWGDLADVLMLDVRSYRDPAVEATDTTTPEGAEMLAPGRTTLGAEQRAWLLDELAGSTAAWRLLGNPYNMAMVRVADLDPGPPRPPDVPPGAGVYFPNEAWDDYQWERRLILEHIRDEEIPNVVSVSAHTHVWIASHMSPDPDDPSQPVVAYDFTTGSLTADPDLLEGSADVAGSIATYLAIARASSAINPWHTFVDFLRFGYSVVTVEPCATTVEFKAVNVYDEDAEPLTMARFRVHSGAEAMQTEFFAAPAWPPVPVEPPLTIEAYGESTGLTAPATSCGPGEPPVEPPPVDPGDPSDPTDPADPDLPTPPPATPVDQPANFNG